MTDQPTRDQLIEQAAQVLYRTQNPKGLGWPTQAEAETDAARADDGRGLVPGDLLALRECYLKMARALADDQRLRDPALEPSAVDILATVRENLGTPDGRAVSIHAAEVRAERDALLPRLADLAEAAGKLRSAEWLRTCATLPMEQWPPAPAYKGPMVPAAERDALQARITDVLAWLEDADGMELTRVGIDALRAKLQGDQPAEPEPRCMNGPAKQHTLHMVGIIKALKAAAELDHLPLEPPRRDNFVRLARAIVDHWPSDIDKPAAPFDLLETEEL